MNIKTMTDREMTLEEVNKEIDKIEAADTMRAWGRANKDKVKRNNAAYRAKQKERMKNE